MTQMNTDGRDPETYAVIGAAMEVHRTLGSGFLEAVYQEALAIELQLREIPFKREVALPLRYKNRLLGCVYRADYLVFEHIVVELKALSALGGVEQAQVINYLKATGLRRGLLLHFGRQRLEVRRVVYDASLCPSVTSVDEEVLNRTRMI